MSGTTLTRGRVDRAGRNRDPGERSRERTDEGREAGREWIALGVTAALGALLAVGACSPVAGPDGGTQDSQQLSLMVTAGASGSGATGGLTVAPSRTFSDGANELILDRVAVVLREIELERQFDDCPEDSVETDDDGCEEFETGPRLLELDLTKDVEQMVEVQVPPDTYDELEFEIHKPEDDDQQDLTFIQQHPDFEDVSIRVEGTWNGEAFVFLQDLNEEQEIDLVPPLEVTPDAGPRNLTLRLDVSTWFRTSAGELVDPRTANKGGANESLVEENIEQSIEAFEDDDRDGVDDDEEDD